MDRKTREKVSKETEDLNNAGNQLDIYRMLHPTTAEYTFCLSAYRIFSKIEHMSGYTICLNKF